MAESDKKVPDEWLTNDMVEKLCIALAAWAQGADHELYTILGDSPLLEAHVHALARALGNDKRFKEMAALLNAPLAFHACLYHFGGADIKLRAPPGQGDRQAFQWSANFFKKAKAEALRWFSLRDKFKSRHHWPQLQQMRTVPYNFLHNLALPGGSEISAPTAPPPPPPPPPPDPTTQQRDQRRADVYFELLCGAFAPGSSLSPFRVFAKGYGELLRLIADYCVIDNPRWIPQPQPRELHRLRKLTWELQLELHAECETSDQRRLEIEELQHEIQSLNQQHAAEIDRLCRKLHDERNDAQTKLTQVMHESEKEIKRLKAKARAKEKEWKDDATEWQVYVGSHPRDYTACSVLCMYSFATSLFAWAYILIVVRTRVMQLYVTRLKKDMDDAVRWTVDEQRSWQLRMRDERNEAAARADELNSRVEELTASLERVRCTSKSGLLQQLAGLQAKVKDLSRRRTLNQRRVRDANLDIRRARVAQESARRLEEAFQENFIESESAEGALKKLELAEARLAGVEAKLKSETELRQKFQQIAEPPLQYFFHGGSYSIEHDLAGLEAITSCHVSAGRVQMLFFIFARFFRIQLPTFTRKVPCKRTADGSTTAQRELYRIGGITHFKEVSAVAGEAHKFQLGEWILSDADANYCYIADGANSLQQEMHAHLLSRRSKKNGKLESMAVSVNAVNDKTAEGQKAGFKQAMASINEAMQELADLNLLDPDMMVSMRLVDDERGSEVQQQPNDEPAARLLPTNASSFFQRNRERMRAQLTNSIAELRPTSSMNDRASTARKGARLVCSKDGSGTDVHDGATCAHHAVANIGEEARKAIDKILKRKMNITDEQAEADAAKIKALRTSVGWFSSPACSLIYQVSKYVALFSSKGYAIGENFAQWLAHKLRTTEQLAGALVGHVEDLLAICGGRDYIFFLDAAVVDRFSQRESLYGYLLEEADLATEAGGKLRRAILTGFASEYCMAAVRSMAIISDAWLWPLLRAIEPGDDAHILDVCPQLWPRVLEWLQEAAHRPDTVIDGSLCLRTRLAAGELRTTPREPPTSKGNLRAERSSIDLQRIRTAIAADAEAQVLVHEMLTAAFTAMADGVRNHAAEFIGDGRFATAKITPELRAAMDGTPITSVMAETIFARIKRRADRGGISRHDTRIGAVLCERDGTVQWLRDKREGERIWRLARRRWRRGSGSLTIAEERYRKGEAKAPERAAKLEKKQGGRVKKAQELERLRNVELAPTYSALKAMMNDELTEQLKVWKLVKKKTGFTINGSRIELVMKLQSLIFEQFGVAANDLPDGDAGTERGKIDGLRRHRANDPGTQGGKGKKGKRKRGQIVNLYDWEWDAEEEFEIERLIGKMTCDGVTPVPGREGEKIPAGTVLYRVLWLGFPPEIATWEEEDQIPCGEIDFVGEYEDALAAEEDQDEEPDEASGAG